MRKRIRSPGAKSGDQHPQRATGPKSRRTLAAETRSRDTAHDRAPKRPKHAPGTRTHSSQPSNETRAERPKRAPGTRTHGPQLSDPTRAKHPSRAPGTRTHGPQLSNSTRAERPKLADHGSAHLERTSQTRPDPIAVPTAVRIVDVDSERAGQRLDNFLMTQLKGVPKSLIYRVLRTGQVRVNGGRAKPETRLVGGDQVRIPPVRLPDKETLAAPSENLADLLASRIVADEREFLVLNKPSGLASHGGSGISLGAIEALRALRPGDTLELVHRLDRDTSGLLAFAKKHSALRKLQALIRDGQVGKRYLALIKGSPAKQRFDVDAPLLKNQLQGGERMVEVDDDGKPSLSRFRVLERFDHATLVEVEIVTGRTHQIRVHALHAGHPLAGDDKYGDADFNRAMKAKGLRRLFLHAHQLRFPWGEQEEKLYSAPLDVDLRAVLEALTSAQV